MKNRVISVIISVMLILSCVPLWAVTASADETYSVNITTSEHGTVSPLGVSVISPGEQILLTLMPDEGYMTESFTLKKRMRNALGEEYYEYAVYDEERFGKPLVSAYTLTLYNDYDIFVNFVPVTAQMRTVTVYNEGEGFFGEEETVYKVREGAYFRNIPSECEVGCNVSAVYMNDYVIYSANSPDYFNSVSFENDNRSFNLIGDYAKVEYDTVIAVTYAYEAEPQYIVAYDVTEGGCCNFFSDSRVSYGSSEGEYDSAFIEMGNSVKFELEAEENYIIDYFRINGSDVDGSADKSEFTYEIDSVERDLFVDIGFKRNNIKINVSASGNGKLNIETGEHSVNNGDSFEVIFVPDEGYGVERVMIDGKSDDAARALGSYKFEDVNENHTISVYFTGSKVTQYTVAVSSGGNGTVLPYGKLALTSGGYVTFTVQPDEGYILSAVSMNDSDIENPYGNTFFLRNVTRNTRIYFEFAPVPTRNNKNTDTDRPTLGLYGDPDLNGTIDMQDIVLLQKYIAMLLTLEDKAKAMGDVDASGNIEMTDVVLIQKYVAKLINEFPASSGTVITSDGDIVIIGNDTADDDSTLNLSDMRELVRYMVGRIQNDWDYNYGDEETYSEFSYASFLAAYKNAVYSTTDKYADIDDLQKIFHNMINAIRNLDYNADFEWDLDTVIGVLQFDVDQFGNQTNDDRKYTADSWNLYISELNNAKTILETPYSYSCQVISDTASNFMSAYVNLRYEILNISREKAYELLGEFITKYEHFTQNNSSIPQKFFNIFVENFYQCKAAYENYSAYTTEQIDEMYDKILDNIDIMFCLTA